MIRVLHSVSNMDRGGIETMLMNYYRHIDREKVQFDFIVNKQKPGDYDDEIRRLGGHIYQSPGLNPLHYPAYLRFVQQTVAADPRIRILHAHNEAMGLYALKGAEKAGLQVRIAHAHNIWIVRDYKFRGSDANFTLKMWPNVRRGEKLYISPYKENADLMFDSSLPDEVAVLKPFVVPLLEALPQGKYEIADDILRGFERIEIMEESNIAPSSLVREFIGGSIYPS
mgnify:CR=1 FL=1